MNYRIRIDFRPQGKPYEEWNEEFKTEDYKDTESLVNEIVTYLYEELEGEYDDENDE